MQSYMKKSLYPLVLLAILALTLPAHARTERIKKTFPANKGGTLVVECDLGSIYVGTVEGDEVFVSVQKNALTRKQLKDFGVSIEQRGNDIYVTGENEQNNNVGVVFAIDVPEDYNVNLRTGEGYIKVGDIKGNVAAYTSEGNIKVAKVAGDLKADAPRGTIHLGKKKTGKSSVHRSGDGTNIDVAGGNVDDLKKEDNT